MPSLTNYISEALKKGYSKNEIKNILLDKGYSQKEINSALNEMGPKKIELKESEIGYIDKIKLLFSSPGGFFSSIREPRIKDSLLLFIYVGLIVTFLSIGIGYLFSAFSFRSLGIMGIFSGGSGIFSSIYLLFFFIFMIVGLFIYTGIMHFTINLMGGSGRYSDTFNACTYSLIPFLLISIIPIIGLISIIYSIILMTIGLANYHGVSKMKAAITALLPILIVGVIFVFFIIYLLSNLLRS